MIPIPNLPTDSLYKFLFVFGIILTISSLYLGIQNIQYLKQDARLSDSLYGNWTSRGHNIITQRARVDKALNEILNMARKKRNERDSNIKEFNKLKSPTKVQIENIKLLQKEVGILNGNASKFLDSVKKFHSNLGDIWDSIKNQQEQFEKKEKINQIGQDVYTKLIYISFSAGVILTLCGGLLWYFKSQIFIDQMIVIQTKQFNQSFNEQSAFLGRKHYQPKIYPSARKRRCQ